MPRDACMNFDVFQTRYFGAACVGRRQARSIRDVVQFEPAALWT